MAKSPLIKFPRIQAGFYGITRDGEFVGYIMKEVDEDSKETNWWIISDSVQGKEQYMLNTADSIDSPDSLLREAKETAKNHFLVQLPTAISPVSPLKEPEWNGNNEVEEAPPVHLNESDVDELDDSLNLDENDSESLVNLQIDEDDDFTLDDELDLDDELVEYVNESNLELALA